VRQCHYSVPARFIGTRVRVSLRANDLVVFHGRAEVARHPRLTRRYDYRDDLDHYLEILLAKPGALAGSTALATARSEGSFTSTHEAFWAAARAAHGDAAGTRALIEVLLLHRRMPATAVITAITATLDAGSTSPDLVAIEARKAATASTENQPLLDDADLAAAGLPLDEHTEAEHPDSEPGGAVISLHPRRALPEDPRPLPSVAIYDQLLNHRPKGSSA